MNRALYMCVTETGLFRKEEGETACKWSEEQGYLPASGPCVSALRKVRKELCPQRQPGFH